MANNRIEGDRLQYRRTVEAVREDLERLLPGSGYGREFQSTLNFLATAKPIGGVQEERAKQAVNEMLARTRRALSGQAKQKDAECPKPDYGSGRGYSTPYRVALNRLADLWKLIDLI